MTTGSILHASFCDFAISAMSTVTMKQSYRVSQCHQAEMRIYDSIFPPTQFKFKKFIFLTLLSTTHDKLFFVQYVKGYKENTLIV